MNTTQRLEKSIAHSQAILVQSENKLAEINKMLQYIDERLESSPLVQMALYIKERFHPNEYNIHSNNEARERKKMALSVQKDLRQNISELQRVIEDGTKNIKLYNQIMELA